MSDERTLANAEDMALMLRMAAVPILKGAGLDVEAAHPHGLSCAQKHYEDLSLADFADRCRAWKRCHTKVFRELACKKCGGRGRVYPNWLSFGDDTPSRCLTCRGDGLGEGVTQQKWDDIARLIGEPTKEQQ